MNKLLPKNIIDYILKNDGVTLDNHLNIVERKNGFVVSFKQFEFKTKTFDENILNEYAKMFLKIETKTPLFLGVWIDSENGFVYYDVNRIMDDEQEAKAFAIENNQVAYFDLRLMITRYIK